MRLRKRSLSAVRRPMVLSRLKLSNAWTVLKFVILIAAVSAGVLVMIFFGFPFIEDTIKGVDPSLRYQPKVEKNFEMTPNGARNQDIEAKEMYLTDFKVKNDPYISGDSIIFTTYSDNNSANVLDSVAIYDITSGEARELSDIKKKYDNLMSPRMSADYAVWIDSLVGGGGRIVGYDLAKNRQFTIKEYGYAMPTLSLDGDMLTLMQWAGDAVQRLYVYNMRTREAVTVKVFDTKIGNSAADVSASDIVWSEYKMDSSGQVTGTLKRIVLGDGSSYYENYNLGDKVFEPKTNGKDIVFATDRDITGGALMLSTGGGEPFMIAEGVLNYDVGDGYVAYTKDDKVYICYTNQQNTYPLTSDITKSLMVSVNGKGITFYDITDGSLDEVVKYAQVE